MEKEDIYRTLEYMKVILRMESLMEEGHFLTLIIGNI